MYISSFTHLVGRISKVTFFEATALFERKNLFGLFLVVVEIHLIINCLISLVFVQQLHTAHLVGRISQTLKDEGLNGQNRERGR